MPRGLVTRETDSTVPKRDITLAMSTSAASAGIQPSHTVRGARVNVDWREEGVEEGTLATNESVGPVSTNKFFE